MGDFKDSLNKKLIREQWCKPLLGHIRKTLNCKLVYLGLPGINALDILSWVEYLDKIIAFECGSYKNRKNLVKAKKGLDQLNKILNRLERTKKIKTYSLYKGYIEKVVLRGFDDEGTPFSQKEVITVYNLDFCNPLTVPLELLDKDGNILKKYYKLEVVRKLLELQRDIETQPKKFIMFLTVHSKFWEEEAETQIDKIGFKNYQKYLKKISKLDSLSKNIRLLRLYVYSILKYHFCSCNFIPEFLPPIYYEGAGDKWLMCFTILGTYNKTPSASAPFYQNLKVILDNSLLSVNKKSIFCLEDINIKENRISSNPLELIYKINSYKKFWCKTKKRITL